MISLDFILQITNRFDFIYFLNFHNILQSILLLVLSHFESVLLGPTE